MIDRFKMDNNTYTVEFSNLSASYRIVSGSRPASELFQASQRLTAFALKLFGIPGLPVIFCDLAVSNGEKPASRLTLTVPTATGESAKLQLPDVLHLELRNREDGQRLEHPQNDYNDMLDEFVEQVEEYVKGRRQQLSLPFDFSPLVKVEAQSEPAAAERIIDFQQA